MIQMLVSSGYGYKDVLNMRYGDFKAYLKAVHQEKQEHYKKMAIAFRVAGSDKKNWEKWINETD